LLLTAEDQPVGPLSNEEPVEQTIIVVAVACVLGTGVIAGVFFAFSSFVMRALASVPSHEGLAARVGPFARDSERFVIRLLIGGIKKPR
jgi:hypothetical protein